MRSARPAAYLSVDVKDRRRFARGRQRHNLGPLTRLHSRYVQVARSPGASVQIFNSPTELSLEQRKAQQEVDEVVGRGRQPNFSDWDRLKYVHVRPLALVMASTHMTHADVRKRGPKMATGRRQRLPSRPHQGRDMARLRPSRRLDGHWQHLGPAP